MFFITQKQTRSAIVDAAFENAKEGGLSSITTRKVAKRLGSSVAPIYVNFETLEALIEAVVAKVIAVSKEIVDSKPHPVRLIGLAPQA